MRWGCLVLIAGLLLVAGCGSDDETMPARERAMPATTTTTTTEQDRRQTTPATRRGTRIAARDSPFGTMLFDAERQAIYIFERDRKGESVCYGECADAWPPVLTDGRPVAASGVDGSLLGTVERRDGKLQVSYDGKPLYYYAHEAPGEVRCHNVDLNGGLWWVIGPDGRRRP